jgi:hypothetical protein
MYQCTNVTDPEITYRRNLVQTTASISPEKKSEVITFCNFSPSGCLLATGDADFSRGKS